MKDTQIWTSESDAYTQRAVEQFGVEDLYKTNPLLADEWPTRLNRYHPSIESVCDIGCGYGLFIHQFLEHYPKAHFWGVDPGEASLAMARQHIPSDRVTFTLGHSHELPVPSDSCDLVVFNMVLQWIPRAMLLRTFAEVDRILKDGGLIFIQDFLPHRPLSSVSRHNDAVRIFKNDYPALMCSVPWFHEVDRRVSRIDEGESMQRLVSIVRKAPIKDVYLDVVGAVEKH